MYLIYGTQPKIKSILALIYINVISPQQSDWQTALNQIGRGSAAPDQVLPCLLRGCTLKIWSTCIKGQIWPPLEQKN